MSTKSSNFVCKKYAHPTYINNEIISFKNSKLKYYINFSNECIAY